jgi:hypothetical protein
MSIHEPHTRAIAADSSASSAGTPVLENTEAERRRLLLAELQTALAGLGIHSTLARKHRLVLRYSDGAAGRNGLTDPQLFVFAESGTTTVATDGSVYKLRDGQEFPAADPAAAAVIICRVPAAAGRF